MKWSEVKARFEVIEKGLERLEKNLFDIEKHLVGYEKPVELSDNEKKLVDDMKSPEKKEVEPLKEEDNKNQKLNTEIVSKGKIGDIVAEKVEEPNRVVTTTKGIRGKTIGAEKE